MAGNEGPQWVDCGFARCAVWRPVFLPQRMAGKGEDAAATAIARRFDEGRRPRTTSSTATPGAMPPGGSNPPGKPAYGLTSNGARRKSSAGLRSKKFIGRNSKRSVRIDITGQSSACVT